MHSSCMLLDTAAATQSSAVNNCHHLDFIVRYIHIWRVFICRPEPQQQQDLLEQALAEEMAKAQRRSGQDASKASQVHFKQVPTNRCHAPVAGINLPVAAVLMPYNDCMSCSTSCRQLHKSVSDRAEVVQHAPSCTCMLSAAQLRHEDHFPSYI